MTTESKLLTADDLMRLHSEGVRGELIRGVLRERQPGGVESGEIIANLGCQISEFLHQHRRGIGTIGSGYLLERRPDSVREAPIAYTSFDKLPPSERITGYAEAAPDLVVEVCGFNRGAAEIHDKARMWLSYGVRLVWVVHPDSRSVDVHRPQAPVETLAEGGELDGLDALPGFRCPVASIFGLTAAD